MRSFNVILLLLLFTATSFGQQKVTVQKIIVSGNNVTRTSFILRELTMEPGAEIPVDSINAVIEENKLRLFNLQLFNEVDQHMNVAGNDIVWYINVKERWPVIPSGILQFADRNINTWWVDQNHDLRRISAGLTVTDRNFRGDLETLAATVQAGFTKKLEINYTRPYVNELQTNGIGFIVGAAQSNQTYYTTSLNKLIYTGNYNGTAISRQLEGGISYLHRPAFASRHTIQLCYKNYWVADTILKLNTDYFAGGSSTARFLELFYRFEYNGTDNWNYSLEGYKLVAAAIARYGFSGIGYQSFVNIEAGMFRKLVPKWYGSIILRGRLMAPANQPYFFRGGLGTQTDYVRGYEYYVIDGSHYSLLRLDLKRELFNNTFTLPITYFTAVPLRIYPKIFADAGYIVSPVPGNSLLSNSFQYSIGAGVDIVTLYDIKVRAEFAYNHLRQNGLYLHFNSE